ncbi:MAG: hypothetical protein ABIF40_02020 [archaeon]
MEALVRGQRYSQSQVDVDALTGKEVDSQLLTYLQGVKNEDKLASLSILLEDLRGMNLEDVDPEVRDLVENHMGLPLGDVSLLERAAEAVHYRLREVSSSQNYNAHLESLKTRGQINSIRNKLTVNLDESFAPVFQDLYEGLVQLYPVLLGIDDISFTTKYDKEKPLEGGLSLDSNFELKRGRKGHINIERKYWTGFVWRSFMIDFIPKYFKDGEIEDLKIKFWLGEYFNDSLKKYLSFWKKGNQITPNEMFECLEKAFYNHPQITKNVITSIRAIPIELNSYFSKRKKELEQVNKDIQEGSMASNVESLEQALTSL